MDTVDLPANDQGRDGLPRHRTRHLVPQLPDGAGQRADRDQRRGRHRLRALPHPGHPARDGAVVFPDHRLRRSPGGQPEGHGLAGAEQDPADGVDRALARCRDHFPGAGRRSALYRVHHPPRYPVRCHLLRAGTRAPARPADYYPRPARGGGRLRGGGGQQDGARADHRAGEDRSLDRGLRDQPRQWHPDPDLDRRLRAGPVRHRRDHGSSRPRSARLRVCPRLRPADHPRLPARGRDAGRRNDDRRGGRSGWHDHQLRPLRRHGQRRGGDPRLHRLAGGARRGHCQDHLQAARLADLPPALLGSADPGRLLRPRRDRAGARERAAGYPARDRRFPSHRHRCGAAGCPGLVDQDHLPHMRRPGPARDRCLGYLPGFLLVLPALPLHRVGRPALRSRHAPGNGCP